MTASQRARPGDPLAAAASGTWLNVGNDPRLHTIAEAARTLDEQRRAWLDPVWAAYGWEEADPGKTDDEAILERLLALNGERQDR